MLAMQISFSFHSLVSAKKNKNPQCGNNGEQILLNEPRKHWPQYMDSGLAHVQNDILFWNKFSNFYLYDCETQRIWNNGIILQHHCL